MFFLGVALRRQVVDIDRSKLNDIRFSRDLQPISTKNGPAFNANDRTRNQIKEPSF